MTIRGRRSPLNWTEAKRNKKIIWTLVQGLAGGKWELTKECRDQKSTAPTELNGSALVGYQLLFSQTTFLSVFTPAQSCQLGCVCSPYGNFEVWVFVGEQVHVLDWSHITHCYKNSCYYTTAAAATATSTYVGLSVKSEFLIPLAMPLQSPIRSLTWKVSIYISIS